MAPRYNLHSQKALLAAQNTPTVVGTTDSISTAQETPGNNPLPGTYVETPIPALAEVEPPKGSSHATTASSRRSSAEIVPGLLFSQVISRSPSPAPPAREECHPLGELFRSYRDPHVESSTEDGSGVIEPPSPQSEDGRWSTVSRRRRHLQRRPSDTKSEPELSKEARCELNAVINSEESSSPEQAREESERSPSHGEGTSKSKGKAVDPHNWGAANLSEEEMDLENQQKELDRYAAKRVQEKDSTHHETSSEEAEPLLEKKSRKKESTHRKKRLNAPKKEQKTKGLRNKSVDRLRGSTQPAEALIGRAMGFSTHKDSRRRRNDESRRLSKNIAPSSQIEPGSYLGRALRDLDNSSPSSPSNSSSSSSSSDSSSESEYNSSSPDDGSSDQTNPPSRRRRQGGKKSSKKHKRRR